MFFDPVYWVVLGIGAALSLWASARTRSTFARYSKFTTQRALSGAEVAQSILSDNGIEDVTVEPIAGRLTDHYDPRSKTLRLSEPVYGGRSMAAFGVAAHEVGHAIQHARGYPLLRFRSFWVPFANIGGNISLFVIIAAAVMGGVATSTGTLLAWVGIGLFSATTLFTLVTLPVELDASRRALKTLEEGNLVNEAELAGARKVLNAAALTYLAAFLASLLTLLYWAYRLGLFGGRRSD